MAENRDALLARVEREAQIPGLVEALAERLSPTDVQSLLLEVYRRRAARTSPSMLLDNYARNRFTRLAHSDARQMAAFDFITAQQIPSEYDYVALSPVAPLGTCSAVATVDQDKSISTARNTEVVSDPTNVMALESALRRRALLRADPRSLERVRLCSSHRVVRAQNFSVPGAYAHFRIFALTTAGRDEGRHRFEHATLVEHLDCHLRVIRAVARAAEEELETRILFTDLTDGPASAALDEHVLTPLRALHPAVDLGFDPSRTSGRGYYRFACFKIHCGGLEIGDGGFTDWTERLLSNRRERFLISCLAGERLVDAAGSLFRTAP